MGGRWVRSVFAPIPEEAALPTTANCRTHQSYRRWRCHSP